MISWSDEQKRVIETRNADILVSAAAGSGKTAVLVERIVGLICDEGMSFDELIVMTFTRAAAAEMKERIEKALYRRFKDDPHNTHIALQLNCIPRARIATIDSICQTLIKQYYQYLDIDPGFRAADEGELKVMKADIIDELLEECYERADDDFMKLAETFSRKTDDSRIAGLIDRLYTFAESKTFPLHFLDEQRKESEREAEGSCEESAWYRFAADKIRETMSDYKELLTAALSLCDETGGPYKYAGYIEECMKAAESIEAAGDYAGMYDAVNGISFGRIPTIKANEDVDPAKKDAVKAVIDSFRDHVKKDLRDKLLILSPDELKLSTKGSAAVNKTVIELTAEFMRRFDAAKREANIVDFADMEHLAIKLLYDERDGEYVPSGIADELAAQLKEIMIDEYQDSNGVQEAILYALSAERFGRPDVFMVGDVKQSIYRFRQADPGIFIGKYDSYSDSGNKILIELNANYRSRSEVVYSTNAVFDRIMRRELGGIEYDENSRLNAMAAYPDNMVKAEDGSLISACRTEMLIADTTKDADDEDRTISDESVFYADEDAAELKKNEIEFAMIADRINELVNKRDRAQSFRLQDGSGLRYADYRDIAILVRKKTNGYAEKLSEVLSANGIPSVYDKNAGFYSAVEVRIMLSMLSIIDNPHQDIPLAAVMRSPMFGFTDDELAYIVAEYTAYLKAAQAESDGQAAAYTERTESGAHAAAYATDGMSRGETAGLFDETDMSDAACRETAAVPDESDAAKLKAEAIGRIKASGRSDFWDAVRHAASENAHAAAFTDAINRYRELAEVLPVHMLLERIYDETGYYDYVTAMPLGDIRRRNLELLSGRAESYAGTGMLGLYNFTRYVEALQDRKHDESSSQSSDENADCVKIVTIHSSKGLEYPIVFIAGCSDPERNHDAYDEIIVDNELGIASDYTDIESGIRYPSFKKAMILMKNSEEDFGERLRLLYVAMTRAKEKLIICASKQALKKETVDERIRNKAAEGSLLSMPGIRNGKLPKMMIKECGSYLDMMLLAAGEDKRAFDIKVYSRDMLVNAAGSRLKREIGAKGRMDVLSLELEGDAGSEYAVRLREMLSAGYAFEAETRLKPKLSVSEIKALAYGDERLETPAASLSYEAAAAYEPQLYNASEPDRDTEYYVDYDDISAEYGEYAESDNVDTNRLKHVINVNKADPITGESTDKPESRSRTSAGGTGGSGSPANRGTAFHRAVELTDFSLNAQENLQHLEKCGRMTETELKILDRDAYVSFMSSELAQRMAEADRDGRLRREQHFMAGIPANRLIASQDSDELQLLQGITDAYITERDGSITLIDYKTDRTSDEEELKSRYSLQLELYAEALGQLTGREVKQKIIYSTFMKRQIML